MTIPKKFLIGGGTVAAGSVATVTIVVAPTIKSAPKIEPKPNQEAVTTWLSSNKPDTNWKIKVEKGGNQWDFNLDSVTNNDLDGLSSYLDEKRNLLESLSSETQTDFTFKKTDKEWKHIWTKEHIDAWVDKTSGNKAVLEVENMSSLTQEEFESLYEFLKKQTSLFTNLSGATETNKKTILLEKIDEEWKHSKTKIEEWLNDNSEIKEKFTIQIQKSNVKTDLEQTNEGDLVGLFSYLRNTRDELLKFKGESEDETTTLTLEKGTEWNIVQDATTIANWITNVFLEKTLEVWYNGKLEQNLPGLEIGDLKNLFTYLKNNRESLLKNQKLVLKKNNGSNEWEATVSNG